MLQKALKKQKKVNTKSEINDSFYIYNLSSSSSFVHFLFTVSEKMKSVEWLKRQISLATPFPELCSFYQKKLDLISIELSPVGTLKLTTNNFTT